jgi:CheY-like chemotaxis protein
MAIMSGPLIECVVDDELRTALGDDVASLDEKVDLVEQLAMRQPDLLVLDARDPRCEALVLTTKSSPATRRIPVLVIAAHADAERMRRAGADAVVDRAAFLADAAACIRAHRRPDESAAIAAAAREPLPARAREAIAQFNAGQYWEQHETFEEVWRAEPGPIRALYQGILQVGVAYLQIERGNYVGARKIFLRAQQYLRILPDICRGIDIARLRVDAAAAFAELERLGPERIAEFPRRMFGPLVIVDSDSG